MDYSDDMMPNTEENKKKGKGESERQGGAQQPLQLSAQVVNLMKNIGLPPQMIASLIANWRHLSGKELKAVFAQFVNKTRTSVHAVVDWTNKGFSLLMEVLKNTNSNPGLENAPVSVHNSNNAINNTAKPQGP